MKETNFHLKLLKAQQRSCSDIIPGSAFISFICEAFHQRPPKIFTEGRWTTQTSLAPRSKSHLLTEIIWAYTIYFVEEI